MSWFNAIAGRAILVGLLGGADVGAVAGAPLPGWGKAFGLLFGAVAGIAVSLACAYAAALDISTSRRPRRTAGPAFARPAATWSVVLSVSMALFWFFVIGPVFALIFALHGLLLVTPLAMVIARATAPWCLAEAVPRLAAARKWLVGGAFVAPVVVAVGASLVWAAMP